ncbi:serine dehydrogenasease [Candidatus Poribacteria bacterium]|nr:serine dehydrogenasease [Candidatus Poribacteria bacterium]
MDPLRPVDRHTRNQLNTYLGKIENALKADVLTISSPMVLSLEYKVKYAIELFQERKSRIAVILDTLGGTIEVVERLVSVIRHHYNEVDFLIPDRAMSAGTVFAMSGDRIFMNYFSCLGPIDPQIVKNDELVPAMSYLNQYQRLSEKAEAGQLNMADITLLNKLDLGELYQFEQARELSHDLLINWLSTYKFKNWDTHSSTGKPVTDEDKKQRAEDIAKVLSDNERWHSHGRMISRDTLTSDSEGIRLKIEKIEDNPDILSALEEYVGLLNDYIQREAYLVCTHS